MMMVASIGAKLFATAGTAATAATGAVKGLTAAQGLQLGSTAFSAFSNFSAAQADADQLNQAAIDERMLRIDEAVTAQNTVAEINRDFVDIAGAQRVAIAANGFDLGSVSARAQRGQALDETNRQVNQVLTNNDIRSRQREVRANRLDKMARKTRRAGLFGGLGQLFGGVAKVLK